MLFSYKVDDEITLALWQEKHAQELFALTDRNRSYLREWLPWLDTTQSPDDSEEYILSMLQKFAHQNGLGVGIWYKGQLAGVIDLHNFSYQKAEIGYWLGQEFSGHGIMTRACRAMLNHGFEELKLHRILILAATGNLKSRAIPERLGFKQEGIARQAEWLYDHFVDLVTYSMLASEWENNSVSEKGN